MYRRLPLTRRSFLLLLLFTLSSVQAFPIPSIVSSCDEKVAFPLLMLYHPREALKRKTIYPWTRETTSLRHWVNEKFPLLTSVGLHVRIHIVDGTTVPSNLWACCHVSDVEQELFHGCTNEPVLLYYDEKKVPSLVTNMTAFLSSFSTPIRPAKHTHRKEKTTILAIFPTRDTTQYEKSLHAYKALALLYPSLPFLFTDETEREVSSFLGKVTTQGTLYYIIKQKEDIETFKSLPELKKALEDGEQTNLYAEAI